jgi:DNA-binding HxlR family transcriptional regulator
MLRVIAGKRTYGDRCGIARALDLVGERWALLIVRDLLLGPKRFTDLRAGLPHVSPDVLSQRLRELEEGGIVRRAKLPPPAGTRVYELTARGQALEPIVIELGRWGSAAPFPDAEAELGVDSAVIALKTVFDPSAADRLAETYELRLNDQPFVIRVADRGLEAKRGNADQPAAVIDTDPATLARVLWHGGKRSDLRVEGDKAAARRFVSLFPLPS